MPFHVATAGETYERRFHGFQFFRQVDAATVVAAFVSGRKKTLPCPTRPCRARSLSGRTNRRGPLRSRDFRRQFRPLEPTSTESVSEGHPDKVADQISDALLDEFLAYDKNSKVACETLVTTGQVVLAGEVKSSAYVDVQEVARGVIEKIGYTKSEYQFEAKSCGVFSSIHEQSGDINRGVERADPYEQGAGDQGMIILMKTICRYGA